MALEVSQFIGLAAGHAGWGAADMSLRACAHIHTHTHTHTHYMQRCQYCSSVHELKDSILHCMFTGKHLVTRVLCVWKFTNRTRILLFLSVKKKRLWWFSFVNVFDILTCVYQGVIFLVGQPSRGQSIFIFQGHFSKNNRLYSWFILCRKILFFNKLDKLNWTIYTFIIYFCHYVPPPPWKWQKIFLIAAGHFLCMLEMAMWSRKREGGSKVIFYAWRNVDVMYGSHWHIKHGSGLLRNW